LGLVDFGDINDFIGLLLAILIGSLDLLNIGLDKLFIDGLEMSLGFISFFVFLGLHGFHLIDDIVQSLDFIDILFNIGLFLSCFDSPIVSITAVSIAVGVSKFFRCNLGFGHIRSSIGSSLCGTLWHDFLVCVCL
jgi:hypothetical protein